jgi:hypothetical protein
VTAKNRVALNAGQRPELALAAPSPRHEITYRATTLDVQPLAPDRADLFLNPHELTQLGPVPIIADALGYRPSTIERHAIGSASTYAEYIAAARELRQTS